MDIGLIGFKFRSPHEAKMAIVSMDNTVRARTPLSEEWRKKKEITNNMSNINNNSGSSSLRNRYLHSSSNRLIDKSGAEARSNSNSNNNNNSSNNNITLTTNKKPNFYEDNYSINNSSISSYGKFLICIQL